VKANRLDAQDTMVAWMKKVTKQLADGSRKGRLDLLSSTLDDDLAGELTVRNMDEIPEGLPVGSPVYVIETGLVYVQDADTRSWEPTA
jgi:hypothetical protein